MKREILFKAKHIHALPENEWMEGKWVEGFLSGEDYINDGTYEYMIDPDTICQYTGLTDKKGTCDMEELRRGSREGRSSRAKRDGSTPRSILCNFF